MKWVNYICLLLILLLVLSPILFMGVFSFSDNRFINFPVEQYSTKWYQSIAHNTDLENSLLITLVTGASVAALSVCFGFMSGYWLVHARGFNKQLALALFTIPSIVPLILYGLGFLEFTRHIGIARTLLAMIIGHTVIFSPLATVYFYHQISKLNKDIEHAARELGAAEFTIIIQIVAGQIKKNIFVCWTIVFALSWDEYIVSWFVTGFKKTYAVQVRNMLESTFSPEVFAVGSITGVISLILLSVVYRFSRKELLV